MDDEYRIWARLFSKEPRLSFFAWQIELTTRCPLKCRMCIRDTAAEWHSADMPIDDFRRLSPYFRKVENLVLEGWGEPLLYKDLIEAVRIVKAAGSHPGFVTSGWGLNREYISDLIEGGLDFIGFSLAGAIPETHDSIRINSHLPDVLRAIGEFNRIKADKGRERPALHIVYLVLEDNIAEISQLLDLAKTVGIGTVVLINPAQVSSNRQNEQKVFSCGGNEAYEQILKEAKIRAEKSKIELRTPCAAPRIHAVCAENPMRNLFISVDGEVSPCVYLYPPIPSPVRKFYCGKEVAVEKLSFGNIFSETLESIWRSEPYAEFRRSLETRRRQLEKCFSPGALVDPDTDRVSRAREIILSDPPVPCRTCHRMLGI